MEVFFTPTSWHIARANQSSPYRTPASQFRQARPLASSLRRRDRAARECFNKALKYRLTPAYHFDIR
jgi:ectoine hydroxylase-related dioxygenase (phytanoyl-CoA dioxygenase family)